MLQRLMSAELAVVLVLLAAAIVMFAINRPRMDAVALIMLTVLPFTSVIAGALARILPAGLPSTGKPVLKMNEALAGFSDANIVLIAALFVIGDGLVRTGVARRLGDWLIAKAGRSEVRLIALLMVVVCGLGAVPVLWAMRSATGMKMAVTAVELIVAPRPQTTTISRAISRTSLLPARTISQSPSR